MTTLLIRMRVLPEKEARFLEITSSIVEAMHGEEPDVRIYAIWRTENAHEYFLVESYLNAEALELHIGRHIAFQEEFGTLLAEPPQVEKLGDFVVGVPDVGTLPYT